MANELQAKDLIANTRPTNTVIPTATATNYIRAGSFSFAWVSEKGDIKQLACYKYVA